jgi:Na+/H+ antiporter NhaD/arsenite permease-like protein
LSAIVLVSVYILLSFEILHRTAAALTGAAVIITIGMATSLIAPYESFEFIQHSISYNTIGLLLGMMIIVVILADSGVFEYVGLKIFKISKGNLWLFLVLISCFTAISSMFIDNVTTILLITPILISLFRKIGINPVPFVLSQVFVSNIGGTATLIGDPPNIMIGSAAGIDFNSFLTYMIPTVLATFAISLLLLKVMMRKHLSANLQLIEKIKTEDAPPINKSLLKQSLVVLFAVIVLFTAFDTLPLETAVIAISGAGILLAVTRVKPEKIFHNVDWSTLIFFAGLFVIVGVAEESGMIELLANATLNMTGGDPWAVFFATIWISATSSAFVDNIPFAATMIPLIDIINQNPNIANTFDGFAISPLWWALALGVGLGGNGTLIGSSAGVVAAGLSEKGGHPISFNQFIKTGMPYMLVTVSIGSLFLFLQTMWLIIKV